MIDFYNHGKRLGTLIEGKPHRRSLYRVKGWIGFVDINSCILYKSRLSRIKVADEIVPWIRSLRFRLYFYLRV